MRVKTLSAVTVNRSGTGGKADASWTRTAPTRTAPTRTVSTRNG